ncbi:hypothetical protein ACFYN0_15195 [Streptomyces sp. NPDC006704]|uniref:hypothetical protein n=1 Tax=Streptomyces sp. NPDC006704 TaxID=3364760 RepID=UPI0036A007DD
MRNWKTSQSSSLPGRRPSCGAISWSATTGDGGGLPDSVYTAPPQNVTVQEIQSINR